MSLKVLYDHMTARFEAPDVDLSGKTIIVTGVSLGGLGYETCIHFAKRNASRLILASRNETKAQKAIAGIRMAVPAYKGNLEFWQVDLDSFRSVVSFCDRVNSPELDRLDIFLANAGVMNSQRQMGSEGYEQTLEINVISTGLMAARVLPVLARTAKLPGNTFKPHLTIVASILHAMAKFTQKSEPNIIAALSDARTATPGDEYNTSKLLDIFLAREIAQLPLAKSLVVNSVHPGLCISELANDMPKLQHAFIRWVSWSTEKGSRNFVWATTQDTAPGAYIEAAKVVESSPFTRSAEGQKVQQQIWSELKDIWTRIDPEVERCLS